MQENGQSERSQLRNEAGVKDQKRGMDEWERRSYLQEEGRMARYHHHHLGIDASPTGRDSAHTQSRSVADTARS